MQKRLDGQPLMATPAKVVTSVQPHCTYAGVASEKASTGPQCRSLYSLLGEAEGESGQVEGQKDPGAGAGGTPGALMRFPERGEAGEEREGEAWFG